MLYFISIWAVYIYELIRNEGCVSYSVWIIISIIAMCGTSWNISWRLILFCYCIMIQCLESTILIFIIEEVFFCWSVLNLWKVFMIINPFIVKFETVKSYFVLRYDAWWLIFWVFLYIICWPENKSKVLKNVPFLRHFFMYLRDILYVKLYNGYVLYVLVSKYVRQNFECIGVYF